MWSPFVLSIWAYQVFLFNYLVGRKTTSSKPNAESTLASFSKTTRSWYLKPPTRSGLTWFPKSTGTVAAHLRWSRVKSFCPEWFYFIDLMNYMQSISSSHCAVRKCKWTFFDPSYRLLLRYRMRCSFLDGFEIQAPPKTAAAFFPWGSSRRRSLIFLLPDASLLWLVLANVFGHAPCALPEPVSSQPWISAPSHLPSCPRPRPSISQ